MPFAQELRSLEQLRQLAAQNPEAAVHGLHEWVGMARCIGDSGLIAHGLCELTRCLRTLNRLTDAAEASGQACVLAESAAELRLLNDALTLHAMLMDDMGRPGDALALVERAMGLECPLDPRDLASTKGVCGSLLCRLGRADEGLHALREAIGIPDLPATERLSRHMALIWHLADEVGHPDEARRELAALRALHVELPEAGPLLTAMMATEVAVMASAPAVAPGLAPRCDDLIAHHSHAPHYATGWALTMAFEGLLRHGHQEAAAWLASAAAQLALELRKPDLHRWTLARQQLARVQGDEALARSLADEADRIQRNDLAPPSQDSRLLVMQLRNLEFRLSLASSRKDTQRLRREIRRRELELRNVRALPPSLLSELSMLAARGGAVADEHDLGRLGFHLVYQPFFDARTGMIKGAEVLLRLQHPELGPLTPAEFIPRLDLSGEIEEVGRWVLVQACSQLRKWQSIYPMQVLAVNVSAGQLAVSGLADHVASLLRAHSLMPGALELEVTETMASSEVDAIGYELERLRALGVGISIDDFGTGYSNFSRLLDLLPNKIKIDRSMINRLQSGDRSRQTIGVLVQTAHSMDIAVTAEGIEHPEQARTLEEMGCDYLQGYLMSRPLDGKSLAKLFEMPASHWRAVMAGGAGGPHAGTAPRQIVPSHSLH